MYHIDNIIGYRKTQEVCEQCLKELKTLCNAGLTLNDETCLLRQTQIQFLGHGIYARHEKG